MCGKIDRSLQSVVKGNKLFRLSMTKPTIYLKSDHTIDNSKGEHNDKNSRDKHQRNLAIKPNPNKEKSTQRENNLNTINIIYGKTAKPKKSTTKIDIVTWVTKKKGIKSTQHQA